MNRAMRTLDREFFKKDVNLVVAKLGDASYIGRLGIVAKNDLLQLQGVSRVVKFDNENARGVLLRQDIHDPAVAEQQMSQSTIDLLRKAKCSFEPYTLTLNYGYWKAEEILAAILPEELLGEIPTGFTVVGHVAHLNVREEYLPYRFLIGQIVLDKNPLIKTVVNKLEAIDTVYRTFGMEVLAGEKNFQVEQSESGCRFRFDFSKVYWNSRLHTEHDRLIQQFRKGEAVCDVFAGVGPFAVPAGRKNVIVLANDLNPDSYDALLTNIKLNKVTELIFPSNLDGRQFIIESATKLLDISEQQKTIQLMPRRITKSKLANVESINIPKSYSHYVMNLPDSAIEFLDGFIGLYNDSDLRLRAFGTDQPSVSNMPLIHVHCFHKCDPELPEPNAEEVYESLRQRVSKALRFDISGNELSFHKVRKVAPSKTMYCITFRLRLEVALLKQ